MKVPPAPPKNGIATEHAVQAAEWALWIEPLTEDENPERELRLGFDTQARLLETVVLVFDSGDQMMIHAMLARKKYLDLLPMSAKDRLVDCQPVSRRIGQARLVDQAAAMTRVGAVVPPVSMPAGWTGLNI